MIADRRHREPVQRGGAGGAVSTSTVTAGPACARQSVSRFKFAVRWASGPKTQRKQAAAVAEHLDAEPGAVVVAERADAGRLWLTVAVVPAMTLREAGRIARCCPDYVDQTFAVEA